MKIAKLISLAVIGLLLVAPIASGMFVLCFGSDGHVAVESANADRCCREWEAAHQELPGDCPATVGAASDLCCSDITLSAQAATLAGPAPKAVPAATVPFSIPALSAPTFRMSAGPVSLAAESPIAAALRTVVLRA
jgi:hypothetical protein